MAKRFKLPVFIFTLVILAIASIPTSVCLANSAEPPSIVIIVPNAPDDLEITIGEENIKAGRTENKLIETYFTFYSYQLKATEYTLNFTTGDETFEIKLDTPLEKYNNIFTLDITNRTLTPGTLLSRSIILWSIRIFLTLLIEAAVFYEFGYRQKRSWAVFLGTNLITQTALYIWLSGFALPLTGSFYLIFDLIIGEFFVFIVEMIAFLILVNEHSRWRTTLYVIIANLLSLIAGGYLIALLPV
ncbi:MAG: hypothetical protein PHE15_02500 [Dehalococcoidales bacterium]|nr:hypothetical protein [Dehalococcoidales bacterium]